MTSYFIGGAAGSLNFSVGVAACWLVRGMRMGHRRRTQPAGMVARVPSPGGN
jgi:hypothetical protein